MRFYSWIIFLTCVCRTVLVYNGTSLGGMQMLMVSLTAVGSLDIPAYETVSRL